MVIQSTARRVGAFVVSVFMAWLLVAGTVHAQHNNTCAMLEEGSWQWWLAGCWAFPALAQMFDLLFSGPTPFLVR